MTRRHSTVFAMAIAAAFVIPFPASAEDNPLPDVVVERPISEQSRANPKLWAECVVGAAVVEDYLDPFRSVGFADLIVLREFDYFSGSSNADTRRIARALGAKAIELCMVKPAQGSDTGRRKPPRGHRRRAGHALS